MSVRRRGLIGTDNSEFEGRVEGAGSVEWSGGKAAGCVTWPGPPEPGALAAAMLPGCCELDSARPSCDPPPSTPGLDTVALPFDELFDDVVGRASLPAH